MSSAAADSTDNVVDAADSNACSILKNEIDFEEQQSASPAPVFEAAEVASDPAISRAETSAAIAFVTAGGILLKYTRAKLINGVPHNPRPKTVRMSGTRMLCDKKAFNITNIKLGGSMLLRANRLCSDFDSNFHVYLSGISAGRDQLDFRAPTKELAQNWVTGVLASIGKLQQS
jgi:hypothetical protein